MPGPGPVQGVCISASRSLPGRGYVQGGYPGPRIPTPRRYTPLLVATEAGGTHPILVNCKLVNVNLSTVVSLEMLTFK